MSFSAGKNLQNNVSTTEAQTLQNKTLDSTNTVNDAPINNSTITGANIVSPDQLQMKQYADLATAQADLTNRSGGELVYVSDIKKTFQVNDDGGTKSLAEISGGQSGVNYIENSDFEQGIDGYTGDVNLTIAQTELAAEVLRGTASAKISKAAVDASGEEISIPFSVDRGDLAKKLTIKLEVDASDANYADGDLRLAVRKDPNGTPSIIRVNGEDIKGGKGTVYAQFQTDAVIDEYELLIQCNSTNALAYDVIIDDVQVGPREVVYGTLVTDWIPYTPTFTGLGTVTNIDIKYRRVGQNLEILGDFTTGTTSATETEMTLPQSLIVGTQNNSTLKVGTFRRDSSVTSSNSFTILATNGDSFLNFSVNNQTSNFNPLEPKLSTQMMASSERISIEATVPIQGWSSNAISSEDLGGREVVVIGEGNNGASVTANVTPVNFTEVVDSTSSWDGTTFTAPETGKYLLVGKMAATSASTYYPWLYVDRGSGYVNERSVGTTSVNGVAKEINCIVDLEKGDSFQIRTTSNLTLDNSDNRFHYLNIQKLASPQSILETETVAARYTSNSGQSIANGVATQLVYEDLVADTHNTYNASTGVYMVPISGWYNVLAKGRQINAAVSAGNTINMSFKVDGVLVDRNVHESNGTNASDATSISNSTFLYLEKGQELTVEITQTSGATTNLSANSADNTFSIARIK